MKDDIKEISKKGIHSLRASLPETRKLASSDDWRKREDVATALREISKRE